MITETRKISINQGINLHLEVLESGKNQWLIVTHGLGEHSARHRHLFDLFSEHYNICLYDLRGHGLSSGKRGYIESFEDYSKDLCELISCLTTEYSMKEYVLFGHSMGGLIVSDLMQNRGEKLKIYPKKVFLSSPAVSGTGFLGNLFNIMPSKFINKIKALPSMQLSGLLDLSKLSHDPRVYESYVTDDLNILKIHSHLILELVMRSKEVFSRPLGVKSELYCVYGTLDGLVDANRIKNYFQTLEKKAVLCEVQGGYHELHNEIKKYRSVYEEFLTTSL